MHIVILESLGVSREKLEGAMKPFQEEGHVFSVYERDTLPDVMELRLKDADAVILANMPLPAEQILNAPKLKLIDVAFTGVDHIGLAAAREKGIVVCNASGYSTHAVSELAVGLLLALMRQLVEQDVRTRSGGTRTGLSLRELYGKTVGIVGTGKIGMHTAGILKAFGCRVVGTSRTRTEGEKDGIPHMPLDDLLRVSDAVILHCPLTEETRGLIGRRELALMRPSSLLINVARGPVVDTEALREALENEQIAGAGLDVYDTEPPLDEHLPILEACHTVLTPHSGYATEEAMEARLEIVFRNLRAFLDGTPENVV